MLMQKGGKIFSEILEQPDRWIEAIKLYNKERETLIWIKKMRFDQIVFTGCGASYAAAIYGASVFRSVGKTFALEVNAGEILASDTIPFDAKRRTLIFALSKTGETDEVIWAVEKVKKVNPETQVLSLTCNGESALAKASTKSIVIEGVEDEGLIPIKSFSTMLFVIALIAGAIGGDAKFLGELSKLPKNIDIRKYYDQIIKMRHIGEVKSTVYCGVAANAGIAMYGSIALKEMSLTSSFFQNSLEFRHGHYITAGNHMLFVYLLSQNVQKAEFEAIRDTAKMKAQIFVVGDEYDDKAAGGFEYAVKMSSGVSPYASVFYAIPVLQIIAFHHSITKGMNPDKPKFLAETVKYKNKPDF
ncbi:MAG: SIS domain-containing protein [Firmicutes bacterium]|nr:SIS domain-containing protein [Bacillota bacterium]